MDQAHKMYISIADVFLFFIYFFIVVYVHFSNVEQLIQVDWARNDFDYCYLIPIIFLYLIFKNRFEILNNESYPSLMGLIPVLFGIVFLVFGELGGEYLISYLSLWLMIIGYFWIRWGGAKFKTVLFPFLFLLTMFPPPSYIYSRLTLHMQLISSALAEFFLRLFGVPVFREGNIIDVGTAKIQVVAACSGLRYLIPMLLVGLLMGYVMRARHVWHRVFLFCCTVPLAIFMNGIRLSLTGLLARTYGAWIVEGTFHDILGWTIFIISIFLLFLIMYFFEDRSSRQVGEQKGGEVCNRYAVRLKGNFWTSGNMKVGASILLIAVSVFFLQYTKQVKQHVPDVRSMSLFPETIGAWKGIRSEISPKIVQELDVTDYVLIDYMDGNGNGINFYVAYYASQSKGESIHSPESCMRGGGWRFLETGVKRIGGGIKVNRSVLANQNQQILSYFWFPCRGRNLTNGIQLKIYNFWDSLTRGRTDGALVRVVTDASDGRIKEADERIAAFLKQAMPILDMYLPNR